MGYFETGSIYIAILYQTSREIKGSKVNSNLPTNKFRNADFSKVKNRNL